MASTKSFKLQQTKSTFKIAGEVTRLGQKSFREGVSGKGVEYRSIRFSVKTSKTNQTPVELFGSENEFVYPFSSAMKKAGKPASLKHPWNKRSDIPDGYHLIGINLGLVQGENGKNEQVSLVEYDAVEYIKNNLHDGDFVWISGEIQFSEYEDKQGNTKRQTRYVIKQIYKNSPTDFEAEDFEELSSFSQEIVFVDAEKDPDTGKTLVNGYSIGYADKYMATVGLVVDPVTHPKMAEKMLKLNFGDWLNVQGEVRNEAVLVEAPEEEEEDEWGSTKPKGFENKGIKQTISELVITAVEAGSYEEKKYTEDDFALDEVDENFGGGGSIDPFGSDEDAPFK